MHLWAQGLRAALLQHTDALTEDIVHACCDFLQGALALRFFKRFEQRFLLFSARCKQFVFCFECTCHGIKLGDTGRCDLPAAELFCQVRALYEPGVACGKAEEKGIFLHGFFC